MTLGMSKAGPFPVNVAINRLFSLISQAALETRTLRVNYSRKGLVHVGLVDHSTQIVTINYKFTFPEFGSLEIGIQTGGEK